MRVCFFNRSYWPDLAATGQLLTELAEDLVARHGCEVTVVTGRPIIGVNGKTAGRAQISEEHQNGVRIVRAASTTFSHRRFAGRAGNYLSYFGLASLAGLRLPPTDIVVALTDPPIIGLAALLAARRAGARFVFLCEDVFPEVARLLEDFRSGTVDRLLQSTNRFLLRKADRVVALGETMARRLIDGKGADPTKIAVIHNWADCSRIVPGAKANPFSTANGLADRFVVMHSGNLGFSQNLDTLLETADLLRAHPRIVFAIVGDGARRSALEARARSAGLDNVKFFPYQPKDTLSDTFASADAFVVSLRADLSGYIVPSKLYGILAAGRPYVAAVEDTCEVAGISREFGCGLVAAPGNAADLARQILRLHDDPDLAARLGANARRAGLNFDRPSQVAKYHEEFRRLCGEAVAG